MLHENTNIVEILKATRKALTLLEKLCHHQKGHIHYKNSTQSVDTPLKTFVNVKKYRSNHIAPHYH